MMIGANASGKGLEIIGFAIYVRSGRRCWNLEGYGRTLDTRLSYRDGCSIMSTCSTCRPLQLNRSPDYPMTHNAHPCAALYSNAHTRTHTHTQVYTYSYTQRRSSSSSSFLFHPSVQLLSLRSLSTGAGMQLRGLLWPSE